MQYHNELELTQQLFQEQQTINNSNINSFVEATDLHYPKYNELANIKLSQREKEIIYWYLRGKSNTETAMILNITKNTVVTHFDRLKTKLGCYYKPHLLLKLIDGEFISPDDWQDIY